MATSPNSKLTSARPDLADGLEEFDLQANQAGFVASRILPVIDVGEAFGEYPVLKVEDLVRKRRDDTRANDGSYGRDSAKGSKDNFSCTEHGFEERVDEREAKMYGKWWDAEMLAAERARNMVLQNYEARAVALANAVSNTTALTTDWKTTASATPIFDVRDAKIKIKKRCGVMPNALCIDWEVFEYLRDCAQIIDRVKSQNYNDVQKDQVTHAMVASALDIEELIVAGGQENTANEGQDAALESLWTADNGLLFCKSDSRNFKRPRWGNTFHYDEDGSSMGQTIEVYYSEERRSDVSRARMDTHEKQIYAACAEKLTNLT